VDLVVMATLLGASLQCFFEDGISNIPLFYSKRVLFEKGLTCEFFVHRHAVTLQRTSGLQFIFPKFSHFDDSYNRYRGQLG
jgi:hypothetical protein